MERMQPNDIMQPDSKLDWYQIRVRFFILCKGVKAFDEKCLKKLLKLSEYGVKK